MRRRPTAMLVLVFQAFFLNIVVPGHTRGIITITGRSTVSGLGDFGCGACCQSHSPGDSKQAPTSKDRANCAICFLAAHYTPPPVIDFRLTLFGLAAILPFPKPLAVQPAEFPPTYYACGPPQAA
jgi:hypothetical protein